MTIILGHHVVTLTGQEVTVGLVIDAALYCVLALWWVRRRRKRREDATP